MNRVRFAARVILLNDNKVFLMQIAPTLAINPKNPLKDPYWITPGGGLEIGESPEQAAKRELFEETGICDAEFVMPHI